MANYRSNCALEALLSLFPPISSPCSHFPNNRDGKRGGGEGKKSCCCGFHCKELKKNKENFLRAFCPSLPSSPLALLWLLCIALISFHAPPPTHIRRKRPFSSLLPPLLTKQLFLLFLGFVHLLLLGGGRGERVFNAVRLI